MYNNPVYLPTIFQVDENIIDKIDLFLKRNDFVFKNILVVSGYNNSADYAEIVLNTLRSNLYKISKNDINTIDALNEYCLINSIDLLIGVGGGSVLDVVKRVSFLNGINNLLVPTIISNDGLISPIAVIIDSNGKTSSLPGKMPFGVVVDLNVIRKAPKRFLQASAGDILSNISATNDWVLSLNQTNEKINDLAYMLSRSAALSLIHHESKDLRNKSFLKQVVTCQINSGLAMALAGTSRPCSGSEHLLSHAIDFLNLSGNTLHGYQVGSISIFCLYLQKRLDVKCLNYANELNIPLAFHHLDPKIMNELSVIYEKSLQMRPGRYTVLDTFKDLSFEDYYYEFLSFLERFKVHESAYLLHE